MHFNVFDLGVCGSWAGKAGWLFRLGRLANARWAIYTVVWAAPLQLMAIRFVSGKNRRG
ncbi:hypothetical protein M441DRAFT_421240 [Trichoderma asperellum CBS 433.97]|uniref:Uncharacterized protein n=1 Tax=Trichoderma asperellum (strain ATCC 204424 / CBS 433.97 / NBRC 101777) TaxID=1042311 RepID=A0A2T3Z4V9_TRIA4|nr:hypothetical protein M441DRAFT_421240 [Trichoderma asperellum CBS 433.97]PTB39858.1 hypothetical protein M441DRAFT_421240 [Trichoderma asperellum CBS 433.97]